MRKSFLFAGSLSFLLAVTSFGRSPQGEHATYKLDRSRGRTSSIIMRGTLLLNVGSFEPKVGKQGAYRSKLHYDMKALIGGKIKGVKDIDIPKEYFSPEFLARLRAEKDVNLDSFKVKHLGFADVHTRFGGDYLNCDKILIYDVKTKADQQNEFVERLEKFVERAYDLQDVDLPAQAIGFKDVLITAYVSSEVPGLGAASLDLSATVSGKHLKVGFDYLPANVPDPDVQVVKPDQDAVK